MAVPHTKSTYTLQGSCPCAVSELTIHLSDGSYMNIEVPRNLHGAHAHLDTCEFMTTISASAVEIVKIHLHVHGPHDLETPLMPRSDEVCSVEEGQMVKPGETLITFLVGFKVLFNVEKGEMEMWATAESDA